MCALAGQRHPCVCTLLRVPSSPRRPYLIRRAHENSAIMGAGVGKQLEMLRTELGKRLRHPLAAGGLFRRPAPAHAVPAGPAAGA
jgi:hypothetical protein